MSRYNIFKHVVRKRDWKMQAIILAGGFGTRLKPLVADLPKPMAPVAGRPFLAWLLEYMAGQGVSETVLCVHHQYEIIEQYFGRRFAGMRLHYAIEKTPLGTGGAIRKALAMLDPDRPVIALNGDSLVEVNYRSMMDHHERHRRPLTIASRHIADCSRYSQLAVTDELITQYDLLGRNAPGDISAGLYVVSPNVFAGCDLPQAFSFERDFLARHTLQLLPAAYGEVDYFIDIGVPHDYLRGVAEIPARLRASEAAA
jgi:D-glycero-alpha-D-manno-heptose 1-phosphate guanylyltransferase